MGLWGRPDREPGPPPPCQHQQDSPPGEAPHQHQHQRRRGSLSPAASSSLILPSHRRGHPHRATSSSRLRREAAGSAAAAQQMAPPASYCPINFFYSHFHDSIKAELDSLAALVGALLDPGPPPAGGSLLGDRSHDLGAKLGSLRDRYRFLEQVYKYHSSVEDEVRRRPRLGAFWWQWSGHEAMALCQSWGGWAEEEQQRCHNAGAGAGVSRRWCTPPWTPRSRT